MEIRKIKLLAGGFNGAEIQYSKVRIDKKREYVDIIDEERNTPIHSDLDKPLKSLRYYLLEICGLVRGDMEKSDIEYTIGECELTSVEFMGDYFIIKGSKTCINNKQFKFSTPKITDGDEYHNFDTVMTIIGIIKKEAVEYLDGSKELSEEELAVRFALSGRDKNVNMAKYEAMNAEEKAVYHQTILEGLGWFVMRPDDVVEDNDENNTILNIVPENEHEEQEIELPTGTDEAF